MSDQSGYQADIQGAFLAVT